jgi:TonB family protein
MRHASLRHRLSPAFSVACFVLAACPAALYAQASGALSGVVADTTGAPIAGAEVFLPGNQGSTRTDERGRFRLVSPSGLVTIGARRIGYEPGIQQIQLNGGLEATHVDIHLRSLPSVLKPVVVRTSRVNYSGRLAGYYRRLEEKNGGYFISRDQIDRENPRSLTQLLTRIPGINATRMRAGGGGVRMRGRTCWPLVWLDGLPMGAGDVDLDAFSPSSLHGIELYLGSTTAPMKYIGTRDQSSCGTILLWSRGPDTDPVTRPSHQKFDLEKMVASLRAYTPDKVDQPAVPDPDHSATVEYPPAIFAAGTGGSVVAEFVVDAMGRVQDGTFGIVSSTDPLLSEAVKEAVENSSYKPAMLKGSAVPQIVVQPFSFPGREKKAPRG